MAFLGAAESRLGMGRASTREYYSAYLPTPFGSSMLSWFSFHGFVFKDSRVRILVEDVGFRSTFPKIQRFKSQPRLRRFFKMILGVDRENDLCLRFHWETWALPQPYPSSSNHISSGPQPQYTDGFH